MKSVDGPWKIICKPYAALWGKQECLDLCHIYSNQAAFLLLSAKGSDSLSQCRIVAFFFSIFSSIGNFILLLGCWVKSLQNLKNYVFIL